MEYPIETINYKGYEIEIGQDDDLEDPRQWDDFSIMFCSHGRYTLGDRDLKKEMTDTNITGSYENIIDYCSSWQEVEKYLIKAYDPIVILPLYLYDHSGVRMKVGSFQGYLPQGHAEFDSGQVGFILVTKERAKKEYNITEGKRISKKLKNKVAEILQSEVDTYDKYISGQVYEYYSEAGSCSGFYDYEEMISEAKQEIDREIEDKKQKKQARTKSLIKSKVALIHR